MGMNPTLAAMYNTHGAGDAATEEQTKIAHLELFCKAAAAQGIDLSQLDDETKGSLYADFTAKLAAEEGEEEGEEEGGEEEGKKPPPKEEGEGEGEEEGEGDEKEAAARAEYAAMQEWQEKNAQADFLGRRMAHAFWDEYNEISKEARGGSSQPSESEAAAFTKKFKAQQEAKRSAGRAAAAEQRLAKGGAGTGASGAKQVSGAEGKAREAARSVSSKVKKIGRTTGGKAALIGGGAALAAGAGYGLHKALKKKEGKKEASAFDVTSAEQGLKIAAAAGWDEEECAMHLNSLLARGVEESEKVAYANGNFEDAVNLRGLELLEEVGYPVDWAQIFGEGE